jgi:hypothetical protein
MAATTTSGFSVHENARTQAISSANTNHRRLITPEAGRALEILGHAIEYLADEYAHEAKLISAHDPQVEAIQLLMALNRQIYFACPVVPTLVERLRALLQAGVT